jgi:diguanylate cyclase (GGDEF)-like protein
MIDLGEAVARPLDRRRAAVTAAVVLVLSFVAVPFVGWPLGTSYTALTMFLSVSCVMMAVSAMLLWAQARVTYSGPLLVLAIAYVATAVMLVASTAAPEPSWSWLLWHVLFAASPIVYVAARQRLQRRDAGALARTQRVGVVIGAIGIGAIVPAAMVLDSSGTMVPSAATGSAVVSLIALGAIGMLVARDRMRSVIDLWLGVAAVCTIVDVLLVVADGRAFTVGWYLSRVCTVVATGSMLTALVMQTAAVYAQLAKTAERLRSESLTDMLTGLVNRRGFDAQLAQAIGDGARRARGVALLMIDIDNFKTYNDTYGHPAGDRCLRLVADVLRKHANRTRDVAARFGGEELALIMPETNLGGAAVVARRLRAAVESLAIPQGNGARHRVVTISIGVCAVSNALEVSPASMLAEADRALYAAKQGGRNRVVLSSAVGFEPVA